MSENPAHENVLNAKNRFRLDMSALRDPRSNYRVKAIKALSYYHDNETYRTILHCTDDRDPEVRLLAVKCIREYSNSSKTSQLEKIMFFDTVNDIRLAAAQAITNTDSPSVSRYIIAVLQTAITKVEEEKKVALSNDLKTVLKNFITDNAAI